ncbi:MAG: PD-(D/E)XK nuclease family protein, partial [Thermodesulfobacteriota bacterium]|nr:PD-(D/E)XK nuclease family protein [Thermodesulfobacteriota bacterium]
LCPVRFFFERLTLLKPVEEVNETGDPAELGTLVHGVLKNFLTPYKGKFMDLAELPVKELQDLFLGSLRESVFYRRMPYDMRLGVKRAGRERLRRFLENQGPTTILELEKEYTREITVDRKKYRVQGRLDRVDKRDGEHCILDYKTGPVAVPSKKIWDNAELWERIKGREENEDPELLSAVATRLSSLQLPLYLFLYHQPPDRPASDAAQVELRDKGEEIWLFGSKFEMDAREAVITEKTPLLLRFLIQHMLGSDAFHPRPGKHCDWCPFGFACASG